MLNMEFFLQLISICVINYGAGNVLFGKIVHRSFQRDMNIKKNILSVKPPNMKTQEIFPNPVF